MFDDVDDDSDVTGDAGTLAAGPSAKMPSLPGIQAGFFSA